MPQVQDEGPTGKMQSGASAPDQADQQGNVDLVYQGWLLEARIQFKDELVTKLLAEKDVDLDLLNKVRQKQAFGQAICHPPLGIAPSMKSRYPSPSIVELAPTLCQQGQHDPGGALPGLQQHSPTHVPVKLPRMRQQPEAHAQTHSKRQRMSAADPEGQLSAQPGHLPQSSNGDHSRQNTPADGGGTDWMKQYPDAEGDLLVLCLLFAPAIADAAHWLSAISSNPDLTPVL